AGGAGGRWRAGGRGGRGRPPHARGDEISSRGSDVVENRRPGGAAMIALDLAVRFRQREVLERQVVMHDQRMLAERSERAFSRARVDRGAVIFGAFDEECYDRRRDVPAAALD